MAEDKSEKGFTIVDRRIGKEGEDSAPASPSAQDEKSRPAAASPEPPPADKASEAAPSSRAPKGEPQETALPPVTFPSLLLSLHASALMHLGLAPDPRQKDQDVIVNLDLARYNIDLLEMLQEKTRGNLSQEESQLMDNILYELRMVYVQVCGAAGKKECESH